MAVGQLDIWLSSAIRPFDMTVNNNALWFIIAAIKSVGKTRTLLPWSADNGDDANFPLHQEATEKNNFITHAAFFHSIEDIVLDPHWTSSDIIQKMNISHNLLDYFYTRSEFTHR